MSAVVDVMPASLRHTLVIRVRGHDGLCLWQIPEPPLGRPERATDRFELRAPGRVTGSIGPLLARSLTASWTPRRCGLDVTFSVRGDLNWFSFYDATTGDIWFARRLPTLVDGRFTRTVKVLGP
jgi:hypothetical protein